MMTVVETPPGDGLPVELEFSGELWYWRGPAPWYFVAVPEPENRDLLAAATALSYGWGCIAVQAWIGATEWETSLMPKDGRYLVPVKAMVREAEGLDEGDIVTVRLAAAPAASPRGPAAPRLPGSPARRQPPRPG